MKWEKLSRYDFKIKLNRVVTFEYTNTVDNVKKCRGGKKRLITCEVEWKECHVLKLDYMDNILSGFWNSWYLKTQDILSLITWVTLEQFFSKRITDVKGHMQMFYQWQIILLQLGIFH